MSDKDRLIEHEYDGIQEYDNPMPRWWVIAFWATILFSVAYALNLGGIGTGPGRIAEYETDMAAWRAAHPQETPVLSAEALLAVAAEPTSVAAGQVVFEGNCVACHAADGGGGIGPNLTDAFWIHGGAITDLYAVITDGVLAKGMPPWGRTLAAEDVAAVTSYVWSLYGTTPAAPKDPEGDPVER
jgi:cytochrome c oxidase cbb3-type subunit 3